MPDENGASWISLYRPIALKNPQMHYAATYVDRQNVSQAASKQELQRPPVSRVGEQEPCIQLCAHPCFHWFES
jgi:hypothetical protein